MITRILLAGCIAGIAVRLAVAAPYCVDQPGVPLQCLYVDPRTCQDAAARQGGVCAANPHEVKTPVTASPYCLVRPGNVMSCVYPDRSSCDAAANRRDGACISATPLPAPGTRPVPDPFRYVRP
jgi:hypothetical protein